MRRILIDSARRHLRAKRGGDPGGGFPGRSIGFYEGTLRSLPGLDEALDRLSKLDPRQSRIVELHFFGGLSVEETSSFLNVSPITVNGIGL